MTSFRFAHYLAVLVVAHLVSHTEAAEIRIIDAKVVLTRDGSTVKNIPAPFPKSALSGIKLNADHNLEISLTVKDENDADLKPQQLMALLTSSSGASAYLVATKKSASSISINQAALEKQIGKQGGVFEVMLLLGDPSAPAGVSWKLGTVEVVVDKEAPEVPAKTLGSQQHVYTKPEIHHVFRPAEKRPPVILSTVFAAGPFALLAGLVAALFGVVGSNFKGLPAGAGGLYALLFHGSIAAMLALYMAFWIRLNLAQTLPVAGVISLAITGTGYKALSTLADARIAESRKKKE